ncbi:hypothetical protein [Actinospica robiniae]|uniref:hypothetical protein n=1 Tax=Actinospica robiniae TaxID=304901 RepID=UPI0012F71EB6|nr:hypothetical protein [Actinospica robiniae]
MDTLESVCERLDSLLTRLASAYRSLPESKLVGRLPDGRTRAAAGHELAVLIATAAQGVEDRSRPSAPSWRPLPYEGPFVVGDQIGVTGHDLLAACARLALGPAAAPGAASASASGEVSASTAVWAPPGVRCDRTGVGTLLTRVLTAAEELSGGLY